MRILKVLWNKYDKKKVADLPRVQFEGRIFIVQTEAEADKAVSYLLSQSLLGFDTESRPSFRVGEVHPVALLQVATHDTCFLFRLNRIDMPKSVLQLLGDKKVKKVALSWHDDIQRLQQRKKFKVGEFFDLQSHVGELGIEDMGLQKLYANVFGEKISKGKQLSNWEADVLTESQMNYAATDAWACVRLYEELERLKQTKDYILKKVEPEPQKQQEV